MLPRAKLGAFAERDRRHHQPLFFLQAAPRRGLVLLDAGQLVLQLLERPSGLLLPRGTCFGLHFLAQHGSHLR